MTSETIRTPRLPIGLLAGLILGAGATFVAVDSAAAGHGTYLPAAVLFPYSMAIAALIGSIPPVLAVLALLQFPAYGAVAAILPNPKRFLLRLALVHGAAALGALVLVARSENFR